MKKQKEYNFYDDHESGYYNGIKYSDKKIEKQLSDQMFDESDKQYINSIQIKDDINAYIIGDMLSLGAQYEISNIEYILDSYGIKYYSARKNKDINDKAKADNNGLAERIFKQDMDEIEKANLIIFNVNQNAIGSLCEIGAVAEWNRLNPNNRKKVICISSDIRRENKETEYGDRRSFSVNAFLYGLILFITDGEGIYNYSNLNKVIKKYLDDLLLANYEKEKNIKRKTS